jgi:pimeloyl-ACP methyl ester carboxylesterase
MSEGRPAVRHVQTQWLDIAYEQHGPEDGDAVILLHGFPYDARSFDDVAPALAARGCRVIVPYLRGYGETRFRSSWTQRSGQQAAIGGDLSDLIEALAIAKALLMGFDWGGRAAAIVAALRPERVRGLVVAGGYQIQDIKALSGVLPPQVEHRLWYQTYFNTQRGRDGLTANRAAFCEHLWRLWSSTWAFSPETYAATAASFDNPDFVDVVIHSYRHRCGAAPGAPGFEPIERRLAEKPPIPVPAIALWGADDGVMPAPAADHDAAWFTGGYERRVLPGVGHNIPQEAPDAVIAALLELRAAT